MKKIALIVVSVLIVFSCASKKKVMTKKSDTNPLEEKVDNPGFNSDEAKDESNHALVPVANSTTEYIAKFKPIAISEMNKHGIPASITLAQGILESGSGKGRLAIKANNHFGIKCHDWNGAKIYHDDDRSQECFRKYKDASYSFRDHSDFLTKRKRYGILFRLEKTDYKAWAKELRRAGYATDKKYPQKLIALIERYELYKYDMLKQDDESIVLTPEEHIVIKGDTLYSISKLYNLPVNYIKKLNGLENTDLQIGQLLYLKRKE